jgi:hypothetical protein
MSKIHILKGNGNRYTAIIHAAVPAGNNKASVAWQTALVNSGLAYPTRMTVGTGAGQIAQAEADQIAAGQVIEAVVLWENKAEWTNAERLQDITRRADQAIAQRLATLAEELAFFGAEA